MPVEPNLPAFLFSPYHRLSSYRRITGYYRIAVSPAISYNTIFHYIADDTGSLSKYKLTKTVELTMPLLNPTPISVDRTELRNLLRTSSGLKSRPGLATILTPSAGRQYLTISRHTSNSGKIYYYAIERDTTTSEVYAKIYNKDLVQHGTTIGTTVTCLDPSRPVYVSQNAYNKLYISGAGLSGPLTCEVGSSPRRAQAASPSTANLQTPPLTPPREISTRFGDRIAVSENNIIYIHYPGTDPEVYTTSGIVAGQGTVTNCIQGIDGNLRIITAVGMTIADQAGLAEEAFDGRTTSIGTYYSSRERTACSCPLGDYALYQDGIINLNNLQQIPLHKQSLTHQTAQPPRIMEQDYRAIGQIFPWSKGVVVSLGINSICVVDLTTGSTSWWDDTRFTTDLVNIIEIDDDQLIFVHKAGAYLTYDDAPDCTCYMSAPLPHDPLVANTVSAMAVSVISDGVQSVTTKVRDSSRTAVPSAVNGASLIGTAVWDTAKAKIKEISTVESNHDKKGNIMSAEVIIGRDTVLVAAYVDDKVEQGKSRRRQT